jgi:methyl-accepting chemotaxis protein
MRSPPDREKGEPPASPQVVTPQHIPVRIVATRSRTHGIWQSVFVKMLAGSLAATLPFLAVVAVVFANVESRQAIDAAKANTEEQAQSVSARVSDFITQRQAELNTVAWFAGTQTSSPSFATRFHELAATLIAYDTIEIVDSEGRVIISSGNEPAIQVAGASWLGTGLVKPTIQTITAGQSGLVWIATAPIQQPGGASQGLVVGDINAGALGSLASLFGTHAPSSTGREVLLVDRDHLLLYSSDWGAATDETSMAQKGALRDTISPAIVDHALAGGVGAARIQDHRHHDVIAGYTSIPSVGWVVISSIDTSVALASPNGLFQLNISASAAGLVVMIGLSILWWRFIVRPVLALSHTAARVEAGDLTARVQLRGGGELRLLGETFNGMLERLSTVLSRLRGEVTESAGNLSVAAEQLAAATFEQTTATTQTSGSMDEVARSSEAIATTVDRVAAQSGEARAAMVLAQADLKASGERTLALVGRVSEIEGILALINDIADQTSLLALNAAIEAARAGDAGRGFAVVADEVRRLAERSKAAGAQIANLVKGAQSQSGETVTALEKGVKQMEEGLAMMQAIVEVSGRVQQATQQQRSTTDLVVRAIEDIARGSRAVAATAQEIASAAARQRTLATDLAGSGWQVIQSDDPQSEHAVPVLTTG